MKRPVVVFTLLWISGYVLAVSMELSWLSLSLGSGLGALGAGVWMLRLPGRLPVSALLLVGLSMSYYQWNDQRNATALLPLAAKQEELSGSDVTLRGRIGGPVSIDGDRAAFTVEAESIRFPASGAFPMRGESVQVSLRLLREEEQAQAASWRRGDAVALQGVLRSPSPARNFGGFDYRRYLRLHRIHWLMTAKGAAQAQVEPAPPQWRPVQLLRWNDELRSYLGGRIDSIFPEHQSGFMKSMLIGMTEDLNPERFQQFSDLGLTHILAISGLNVAVFLGVCIWIMRRLRMTKETYLAVSMALLPFYILLTGASPSIVRAGLMAMIALYAARRGILKDALHLTAIVALLMLLWNPYYLLDVSFQLSFLVTVGLIVGVQRVSCLLPFQSAMIRNALSITIVSQLISFPVSIYYFNQFSLISWLANTLLVPVISLGVFPAGLAALALGLIYQPLGRLLGAGIGFGNDALFFVTDRLHQLRIFQTIWPSPSIAWIAVYYLLLYLLYAGLAKRRREREEAPPWLEPGIPSPFRLFLSQSRILIFFLSGLLALALYIGYSPDRWNRSGQVAFLDVGQGDSILIRTPEGRHILVDGGGTLNFGKPGEDWKERRDPYEVGKKLLAPLLKKRGVHDLDAIILTHEDSDHSGGLQAVIEQIPVKLLFFNGTLKPNQGIEKLLQTAVDRKIPLIPIEAGQKLHIDGHTELSFLYPFPDGSEQIELAPEQNNLSIVFLMDLDGTKWLFTGDMEKGAEQELLQALSDEDQSRIRPLSGFLPKQGDGGGGVPSIDVLKVAHHGSKTSTTAAWLDFWKPRISVISVGEQNSYGHPSSDVLQRLEQHRISVYRTDQMGEIQMVIHEGAIYSRTKLN